MEKGMRTIYLHELNKGFLYNRNLKTAEEYNYQNIVSRTTKLWILVRIERQIIMVIPHLKDINWMFLY